MNKDETQNLAEKIARLLQAETQTADLNSLQMSLERINQRLDRIESQIDFHTPKSQITNSKPIHSSQEKFINLDELASEIITNPETEKACPYEPTGKPCDHCAMCNSRGF